MIFSACRINRECREKIPTKINNKQDIVTCWDFCRSLVRLVSQHNTYKCTNHQKHGYLNHNEHVPWTDSKGYVQGENIEGFQALDDEQILLYMITDGIWNVYSVENGPVSHVWNSSFHFWPESSMIWLQRFAIQEVEKWWFFNATQTVCTSTNWQLLSTFSIFICYDKQLFKKKTFLNSYMYVWKCMMIELFSYIVWQLSAVTDF